MHHHIMTMRAAVLRALLCMPIVGVTSCHVFVPESIIERRHPGAKPKQTIPVSLAARRPELFIRGGDADYRGEAQGLFGNLIGPATFLAGSLVPLGFLAPPLPGRKTCHKRIRYAYSLLAVFSLCNEASAIVYATVASNKLTEIASAPAASVFDLIKRDYELSWIATNVHFLFGLFGFLSMIGVRALMCFPAQLNKATAGIAVSALLGMCSVVNRGVVAGDGSGHMYGNSILTLVTRYIVLLVNQVQKSGGILAMASISLGVVSLALALHAVIACESDEESDKKK